MPSLYCLGRTACGFTTLDLPLLPPIRTWSRTIARSTTMYTKYTKQGSLRGRLTLTAALTVAALPGSLAAQNRMEGVVIFRMEGNDGKVDTVTQTTKGRNVRL